MKKQSILVATFLLGCGSEEGGRPALRITEVEQKTVVSGTTTTNMVAISYVGNKVERMSIRANGTAAGSMEAVYDGNQIVALKYIDADGHSAQEDHSYASDRLIETVYRIPTHLTRTTTHEYDEAASYRLRRTTQVENPTGGSMSTQVTNYDYNDKGELVTIDSGASSFKAEMRYDDAGVLNRYSLYSNNQLQELFTLTYSASSKNLVSALSDDGDRYDVSYDSANRIAEIDYQPAGAGARITTTYRYGEGSMDGGAFAPHLPMGGFIDLKGKAYAGLDALSFVPALAVGNIPAPTNAGACNNDGTCQDGESASCADCTSNTGCNNNGVCDSGETTSCADCSTNAMCNGWTAQDACEQCAFTSCCAQITSCTNNSSCNSLWSCLSGCSDSTCRQSCADQYPSGVTPLNQMASCLDTCPTCN